jgi:hypothetical protein
MHVGLFALIALIVVVIATIFIAISGINNSTGVPYLGLWDQRIAGKSRAWDQQRRLGIPVFAGSAWQDLGKYPLTV